MRIQVAVLKVAEEGRKRGEIHADLQTGRTEFQVIRPVILRSEYQAMTSQRVLPDLERSTYREEPVHTCNSVQGVYIDLVNLSLLTNNRKSVRDLAAAHG